MQSRQFQSTRPIRGATLLSTSAKAKDVLFQSTRPIRGATYDLQWQSSCLCISIHAPHTGRDPSRRPGWTLRPYFNPRAPYGARLCEVCPALRSDGFQSTRPIRGATKPLGLWDIADMVFQSTRPIRGATHAKLALSHYQKFQSTRPIRGATWSGYSVTTMRHIFQSTRPIRGATMKCPAFATTTNKFQSTRPIRGATIVNPP